MITEVTAWRLAKPKFACNAEQMLSGAGARLNGGRWNSPGAAVVYLSESLALAAMELLVGLNQRSVLNTYRKMPVYFPEELVRRIKYAELPDNWKKEEIHPSTQKLGDQWLEAGNSAVLQVPSAVVLGESNYLVNPKHPDFARIRKGKIECFHYDRRLAGGKL